MKILLESYNNVMQNDSGGIQVRIKKFMHNYHENNNKNEIRLFNKWEDKICNYDIVHIFKANIESYQLVKLAKSKNIPVVVSSVIPQQDRFKIIFNRMISKILPVHTGYWFLNELLNEADVVISQTEKEAIFVSKNYKIDKNKIHVIPNGINVDFDEKNKGEFLKRTGINRKFILQVGRFDENKNQLNVIKAMRNTGIDVVFIGGEDPTCPEYYTECKKHATSNIHFMGWIEHDDPLLSSAYQNAHVVILPSHNEIFGNSLIEGGAAGANLIATKELPIKDWGIEEICRCIDPKDIRNIKETIIDAFESPINPNTSKIIKEKFSWKNVINKHNEIYERLIEKEITND